MKTNSNSPLMLPIWENNVFPGYIELVTAALEFYVQNTLQVLNLVSVLDWKQYCFPAVVIQGKGHFNVSYFILKIFYRETEQEDLRAA